MGSAASFFVPMELLASYRRKVSPNDQINVGLIGCNGMGFSNLTSFLKLSEVNVVALCDVDQSVLAKRTSDLEKGWY